MSLRETYQSRKNLLAANLTQQGVTASGSEGLTTLINKVLDISPAPTPTTLKTYINGVEVDNTQELPANIISYADSEYIDYKFVVLDENSNPVQGYSIPLSVGGSAVTPTPVTDSNGEVSYRYVSGGVGDTNISINCTLLTKRYDVQDCLYYNDGTKDDLTYQNGDFGSVVTEGLQLKSTSSGYQKAVIPIDLFSTNDNVSCEIKLGTYTSNTPQLVLYDSSYTNQGSVSGNNTYNEISSELSTSARTVRHSAPVVNEIWKITRENGQSKFYIDDVLLDTVTRTVNSFRFGFYTYNNRTEVIKYIKIKPL